MSDKRRLTQKDVLNFQVPNDAQISPDGELIAFAITESHVVDTDLPKSSIWIVPTEGGEPARFTNHPTASDTTPRWSPDGQNLAFLSDREEAGLRQIYLAGRDFGDVRPLTEPCGQMPVHRGMAGLTWLADSRTVVYLMEDPETEEEKRRQSDKRDVIEFEKRPKYVRLYSVDFETGDVTCISPDDLQIWEFSITPDGWHVAAAVSDLPYENDWYLNRLVRFEAGSRQVMTLYDTSRQVAHPVWSPDGRQIAFTSSTWSDKHSVRGGLFAINSEGGDTREISAGQTVSYSWMEWSADGSMLTALAQKGGGHQFAEVNVETAETHSLMDGPEVIAEVNYPSFSRDRDGNMAVIVEDADHPRDVWIARPVDGVLDRTQLTDLHPQAKNLDIGTTEEIEWKGADGWHIQGYLIRPPGYTNGHRIPLITIVHGGPTSAQGNVYLPAAPGNQAQLYATAGMAVLLPNPRGSTGWGLEFAEANLGDIGGRDWIDIQNGIDHCIDIGVADPNRLGITGSSYGGFMSGWAITQTDRFRAAVPSAGTYDWRSFHGTTEIQYFGNIFLDDNDPYDVDSLYHTRAPITHIRNAKTPTLILHGEKDLVCPVEQAYEFHRALRRQGVETELVVYPREPHGYKEREHLLDIAERSVEWMVKHLEP